MSLGRSKLSGPFLSVLLWGLTHGRPFRANKSERKSSYLPNRRQALHRSVKRSHIGGHARLLFHLDVQTGLAGLHGGPAGRRAAKRQRTMEAGWPRANDTFFQT